jgi:hypothetical protein
MAVPSFCIMCLVKRRRESPAGAKDWEWAGRSPASTHSGSGSGFVILALLFKIGSEQLAILDGGQEEKNADKKVFHKKPGVKMIQNTSALQGRINTRGTEEQLVG